LTATWPTDLVEAVNRRDIVLVVGAGVSMNSKNSDGDSPPGWKELIRRLSEVAAGSTAVDGQLQKQLDSDALLDAAERVVAKAQLNGRVRDIQKSLKDLTDGVVGKSFEPNDWHNAILMLEPRVIVTTNYDRLIERACKSGFQVHTHNSDTVGQEVRRGDPVLVKIHGSVDDLEKIVLTQSDYARLHVAGRHTLDVLQALFLTRVVLFVGYSMSDPDIRLLLQNTVGGRNQAPSHYMLTSELDEFQKQMLQDAFGVIPILYPEGHHDEGLKMLEQLTALPPSAV
jgi:hypothetical protein